MILGFDAPVQLSEYQLEVAHDRHVHVDVLAYLRRVDLNVNLLRVDGELGRLARDPVVEPHSEGYQQVGLLDGKAGVGHAVHTGHTDAQ